MNDIGGKRLWIGNLDERITEFTLLKLLQKYGKIEQFDFLFHKSGPNQGKPRGYCFASYEKRTDAVHALHSLDGKLALGKKLAVKWAHSHIKQAATEPVPLEQPVINLNPDKIPGTFGGSATKVAEEPTSRKRSFNPSVHSQIRAIEGKLREMERQTAKSTFKPIPVYATKRPKTPTEVTEKCLPSLLTIDVKPPTSTTSATSTSSSASSSAIPTSSSSSSSSATAAAEAASSSTSTSSSSAAAAASSSAATTTSSSANESSLVSTSTQRGTERTGTIITSNEATSLSTSSSSSVSKASGVMTKTSQTGPLCSSTVKPSGKTKAVSRPKPYDKR